MNPNIFIYQCLHVCICACLCVCLFLCARVIGERVRLPPLPISVSRTVFLVLCQNCINSDICQPSGWLLLLWLIFLTSDQTLRKWRVVYCFCICSSATLPSSALFSPHRFPYLVPELFKQWYLSTVLVTAFVLDEFTRPVTKHNESGVSCIAFVSVPAPLSHLPPYPHPQWDQENRLVHLRSQQYVRW